MKNYLFCIDRLPGPLQVPADTISLRIKYRQDDWVTAIVRTPKDTTAHAVYEEGGVCYLGPVLQRNERR